IRDYKVTGVQTCAFRSLRSGSGEAPLAAGEVIDGRYRIIDRLATGGMGEVFRAEHVELGKKVALKVMLSSLSREDDWVQRFKREIGRASCRERVWHAVV